MKTEAQIRLQGLNALINALGLVEAEQFIAAVSKGRLDTPGGDARTYNQMTQHIACPEGVAWRQKWIDDAKLAQLAEPLAKSQYGKYLQNLLNDKAYG